MTAVSLSSALAQQGAGFHQPLSQHTPPGQTAGWLNAIRSYDPTWMQPLKIEVQGGGRIDVFASSPAPAASSPSPCLVAVNVGHLYRLRVSELPGAPGTDVYPTIELIDHLHPPAGRAHEFPIPIVITQQDIAQAEAGQLVTRVIYLEQPQIAQVIDPLRRDPPQSVLPQENALAEADRLGRPMAIIRIGGRKATAYPTPGFYGNGGAVQQLNTDAAGAATVRLRSAQPIQQTSGRLR